MISPPDLQHLFIHHNSLKQLSNFKLCVRSSFFIFMFWTVFHFRATSIPMLHHHLMGHDTVVVLVEHLLVLLDGEVLHAGLHIVLTAQWMEQAWLLQTRCFIIPPLDVQSLPGSQAMRTSPGHPESGRTGIWRQGRTPGGEI